MQVPVLHSMPTKCVVQYTSILGYMISYLVCIIYVYVSLQHASRSNSKFYGEAFRVVFWSKSNRWFNMSQMAQDICVFPKHQDNFGKGFGHKSPSSNKSRVDGRNPSHLCKRHPCSTFACTYNNMCWHMHLYVQMHVCMGGAHAQLFIRWGCGLRRAVCILVRRSVVGDVRLGGWAHNASPYTLWRAGFIYK